MNRWAIFKKLFHDNKELGDQTSGRTKKPRSTVTQSAGFGFG
jgi:hypothetical protein